MATAHIIQVPVESLEIIELPGITTFRPFAHPNSRDMVLKATLTLKTSASSQPFTRRVNICDVSLTVPDALLPQLFHDRITFEHTIDENIVLFLCELSRQWFYGRYDYSTHEGKLQAFGHDESLDEEHDPIWNL